VDSIGLREIVRLTESATLEFKQALQVYAAGEGGQRNRHELIKDILALANGSADTAAHEKHLIFGVSDVLTDGSRQFFDVGNQVPTADDLLKMLREHSYPGLERIEAEVVAIDGKRIFVVTNPPTRYLHETTKPLKTPSRQYTEHTVFMRRGSSVTIASDSDRAAIRRSKQKFFEERHDVPPVAFGAATGALLLAPIGRQRAQERLPHLGVSGELLGGTILGVVGAIIGAMFGKTTTDIRSIKRQWPELTLAEKLMGITVAGIMGSVYAAIANRIRVRRQN
jgi:hypothetical protein